MVNSIWTNAYCVTYLLAGPKQPFNIKLGKNEGELLIPPINIHELALTTNKNDSDAWKNKWTMVIRGSDQCSGICEEALHLTRQIHIRLNEKADRVRRIYLSDMSDLSPDLSKNLGES